MRLPAYLHAVAKEHELMCSKLALKFQAIETAEVPLQIQPRAINFDISLNERISACCHRVTAASCVYVKLFLAVQK